MKARQFHLGDIISVYTGIMVSRSRMDGVFEFLNHMSGERLSLQQLADVKDLAKPELEKQFSWLKDAAAQVEADFAAGIVGTTQDSTNSYVDGIAQHYGAHHSVKPLPNGYDRRPTAASTNALKDKPVVAARL